MTQIAKNVRDGETTTSPEVRDRILSEQAEDRLSTIYPAAKFTAAGALLGLVIVLVYEQLAGIPDLPKVEYIAMCAGAVVVLGITRLLHVR